MRTVKSFYPEEITMLEHKLLFELYDENGLDSFGRYAEGVLDMTQKILNEFKDKEE